MVAYDFFMQSDFHSILCLSMDIWVTGLTFPFELINEGRTVNNKNLSFF